MSQFLSREAIEKIEQMARQAVQIVMAPGTNVPVAIYPELAGGGMTVKAMPELVFNDYEKPLLRIAQTVKVLDAQSFIKYFLDFKLVNSRIFAHEPTASVTSILDYHGAGNDIDGYLDSPGRCAHKLVLELQHSPRWIAWTGKNNVKMEQTAFAEFLEQYSIDVVTPSPAHIMDVARDLHVSQTAEFSGGPRANGQFSFKYSENVKGTVKTGSVEVPERFTIKIPCYVGGPEVLMEALLRYRLKDGKLEIWFSLVRPEEVKRQAFLGSREAIETGTGMAIINGAA